MKNNRLLLIAALALCAGSAFADEAANAERCKALGAEINGTFKAAMLERVPKSDPATAVQNSTDIKGILSQDVTSGLSKLMNLDFSGVIQSLVTKGLDKAAQKASSSFLRNVNGVLGQFGVPGVNFNSGTLGIGSGTSILNNIAGNVTNSAVNSVKNSVGNAASNIGIKGPISNSLSNSAGNLIQKAAETVKNPYVRPSGGG